ncbi:hypothetical protein VPHK449_0109 [Vibrio phage K449]
MSIGFFRYRIQFLRRRNYLTHQGATSWLHHVQ